MHIELDIPVEEALSTPVQVFRAPKRHMGVVAEGQPDPPYRAFELLYVANIVTPLLAGISKWFRVWVEWTPNMAPRLLSLTAGHTAALLDLMGVVEVALAVFVLARPRWGGWAVAAWLWCGVLNFALTPGHDGLALCLLTMSLGAVAMSMLAKDYEHFITRRAP